MKCSSPALMLAAIAVSSAALGAQAKLHPMAVKAVKTVAFSKSDKEARRMAFEITKWQRRGKLHYRSDLERGLLMVYDNKSVGKNRRPLILRTLAVIGESATADFFAKRVHDNIYGSEILKILMPPLCTFLERNRPPTMAETAKKAEEGEDGEEVAEPVKAPAPSRDPATDRAIGGLVEALIGLVTSVEGEVRLSAIEALGKSGRNEAVQTLVDLLRIPATKAPASKALQELTGSRASTDADAWAGHIAGLAPELEVTSGGGIGGGTGGLPITMGRPEDVLPEVPVTPKEVIEAAKEKQKKSYIPEIALLALASVLMVSFFVVRQRVNAPQDPKKRSRR